VVRVRDHGLYSLIQAAPPAKGTTKTAGWYQGSKPRGLVVPTYISLTKYTSQGITNIKDAPERIKAAHAAIEAAGGKMLSYHVTMGQYDSVAIVESPDDETALTMLLALGTQGNISTETMRAFTEEEFTGIVGNLP
jgi:uncharacterized protein with GYD domain